MNPRLISAFMAGAALVAAAAPAPALAQAAPVYAESPSDALARNVRVLASSPRDFQALIGAGKAALQTGDPQAAAGFFGRAAAVNPNSYVPQAGLGAALVASGDAAMALSYFARAQQLGGTAATFGADRGLAYDLMGSQASAQADYRAALYGQDRDDARRRLALSLAISGKKDEALLTLQPLLQQRDVGAQRARAFILALDGDVTDAKAALDYMMPGASARMDPFFRRLPQLAAAQKAAAVHLGIFPEDGSSNQVTIAASQVVSASAPQGGDRLASIEQLLAQPQVTARSAPAVARPAVQSVTRQYSPPVQVASVSRRDLRRAASPNNEYIQTKRVTVGSGGARIWLQLASGRDPEGFREQFRKIRSRDPSLFNGISGYVAQDSAKARLVIGPFHSADDAHLFEEALQSVNVNAFRWTSGPGEDVIQLPSE